MAGLVVLSTAAPASPPTVLRPCPASPNCVSSEATDAPHQMAPWPFTGPAEAVLPRLVAIVQAEPRTAIVTQRSNYLHATFTSRLFRFVDDVEFVVDSAAQVVRFRSASRVGRSDLGVNRQRMERLARAFAASAP